MPSFEKYLKKQTSIATSTKIPENVPSPAVTIIPNKGFDADLPLGGCISNYSTAQEAFECILENSYNLSEVISGESQDGTWRMELTEPGTGVFWTREDSFQMSTKQAESYSLFSNGVGTSIFLYDPNFFLINTNPVTIPKFTRQGNDFDNDLYKFYIEVSEITKINMVTHRCMPSMKYSFTNCIKSYVIKVVVSALFQFISIINFSKLAANLTGKLW